MSAPSATAIATATTTAGAAPGVVTLARRIAVVLGASVSTIVFALADPSGERISFIMVAPA